MDTITHANRWPGQPSQRRLSRLVLLMALAMGLLLAAYNAQALTLPIPASGNVVGYVKASKIRPGESLSDVARRFDIGYYELLEANPNINPMRPKAGQTVTIPTRYVLPSGPKEGIVINLAELRLYYYPPGQNVVITEPIGIGRQGWATPTGDLKVIQKKKDPTWNVPPTVRADLARKGIIYPKKVPPGPDNPLGRYMLRLSNHTYLIHGTNSPKGVGRRVSAGCIRMYPEDIERLFYSVKVGTPVRIVNEPFKVAWKGNKLYMEAHQPLKETRVTSSGQFKSMWSNAVKKAAGDRNVHINWNKVNRVGRGQHGLPIVVGNSS